MDDLKRRPYPGSFPGVPGNSSGLIHHQGNQNMGLPVQFIWDDELQRMDRSAAFGVVERGRREEKATWLVYEGADGQVQSHRSLAKALDDVFVAYGQNGEPLRVEQGLLSDDRPGWEGPFSASTCGISR
jgi:hypothetical protein